MTCRKATALRYRIFALFAVLAVAVLSAIAVLFAFGQKAHAETETQEQSNITVRAEGRTHDQIFGVDHNRATEITTAADIESFSSGIYCLGEDINITKSKGFFGDEQIDICLHGHSISIGYGWIFEIYSGANISVYDCVGTGALSSQLGNSVVGSKNYSDDTIEPGVFNLYGGTIKGGKNGSAVSVSRYGIFNMYGGAIKDNQRDTKSSGSPAVEVMVNGTFNMYGGEISNNITSDSYGGAGVYLYDVSSVFHMYGGSITGNVTDCTNAAADSKVSFYNGAGVNFKTGTFSIEGNANISGNIKRDGETDTINNVYVSNGLKIDISGTLDASSHIGITAAKGAFTSGYKSHGNNADPSEFFTYDGGADSGLKIGYDPFENEAAVVEKNDSGTYVFDSAEIIDAAAATVGDTEVTFTVKVTLVNSVDSSKKETDTVTHKVTLAQPLRGGNNNVSFDFTYKGTTRKLSRVVVPAKFTTSVTWTCDGGTMVDLRTYKLDYDGSDAISAITAVYKDFDGEDVTVNGSPTSGDILVQDAQGNPVDTTAVAGVYKFYLAPSADYDFLLNLCTVEVVTNQTVEDGYNKMIAAEVVKLIGTPKAGDKQITVSLKVTYANSKTGNESSNTLNYQVKLETPLAAGENTISFVYKYTDANKDVQTENLTVKVNAAKKQVVIKWYYNGSLKNNNSVNHVFDGVDVSKNIVAVYDGIDGKKQNVDDTSADMIKKDKSGNIVTSMKDIGEYTLSLKDSDDYEFGNNLFTYVVVEKLSDISDLTYEESGTIIFGVSYSDGGKFENGTELEVSAATDISPNVVYGEIKTAYNVSFVKNSTEIGHSGKLTVNVLIPADLKGKTYKIFNLKDGVATEIEYTAGGNYASFETNDLTCLLFVEVMATPPITDPNIPDMPDNPNNPNNPNNPGNTGDEPIRATIDGSDITWLWVVLAILGACAIIVVAVLIAKAKSKKNK